MLEYMTRCRRELHRIPELENQLPETCAYVKGQLQGLHCRITEPVQGSVCAFFDEGKEDAIAFRADMDALPITEQTGLPFASAHPGKMHACGHDGHTAMLLGLARIIEQKRGTLPHNVLLVFQPGRGCCVKAVFLKPAGCAAFLAFICGQSCPRERFTPVPAP